MPKGGYKIISMKNVNLTSSNATVPGAYEAFESLNGKPALITDLLINGNVRQPMYAMIRGAGETFAFPVTLSASQIVQVYVNQGDQVRTVTSAYGVESPANDPVGEDGPSASM